MVQFSDTLVYRRHNVRLISAELDRDFIMSVGKSELIGQSAAMRDVRRLIEIAAQQTTVLVLGETGTGKELVAAACMRNLHEKANWSR